MGRRTDGGSGGCCGWQARVSGCLFDAPVSRLVGRSGEKGEQEAKKLSGHSVLDTHLGSQLPDVVEHPSDRGLQRLVGVAPRGQLDQPLAVLRDEGVALGIPARGGKAGQSRSRAVGEHWSGTWRGKGWMCGRYWVQAPAAAALSGSSSSSGSTGSTVGWSGLVRTHPFSSVAAFSRCSCAAGLTSSMPIEKPASPMKRALQGGRAASGRRM